MIGHGFWFSLSRRITAAAAARRADGAGQRRRVAWPARQMHRNRLAVSAQGSCGLLRDAPAPAAGATPPSPPPPRARVRVGALAAAGVIPGRRGSPAASLQLAPGTSCSVSGFRKERQKSLRCDCTLRLFR